MEYFFGTPKRKMVHHRKYRTRQEAMVEEISGDIEGLYNRQRRHASLGNLSPAAYWKKFIRRQGAV